MSEKTGSLAAPRRRGAPQRIAITVATRERPDGCRRLVDSLLMQHVGPDQRFHVIVVDNAPGGSGLELPEDERITVVREPETGIPFARNRALREALPWADLVVFVDDDEAPASETWLHHLVDVLHACGADGVTGPVRSVFAGEVPAWIARHPLFRRATHRTGQPVRSAYTNNLALRAEVFEDLDRWFDERLRYTGGSDTELTRRVVAAGRRIVWTNDVVVREQVSGERARLGWILRRSLRIGANRAQRLRLDDASPRRQAVYAAAATAEMICGAGLALLTPIVGRARGLVGLGRACRGAGTVSAMVGGPKVEEYRSVRDAT